MDPRLIVTFVPDMAAHCNVRGQDKGGKSGTTYHRHTVTKFWKEQERTVSVGIFPSLLETPGMEETETRILF
jgi:hypothetical protein